MDKTPWSNTLLKRKCDETQLDWGCTRYKFSIRMQKCRVTKILCNLHVFVSTLNGKKKVMNADIHIDQERDLTEEISR